MNLQNQIQNAVFQHNNGNITEAIKMYREILHNDPQSDETAMLEGIALRQIGQYSESLELMNRLSLRQPSNGKVFYEIALTSKMLNRPVQVILDLLNRAVNNGFSNVGVQFFLGDMYRLTNDYKHAIVWFSEVVKVKKDHFLAFFYLGMLYRELNDYENAVHNLSTALRLRPDSVEVHNNLGLLFGSTGEKEKAMEHFGEAFKKKPEEMSICTNYVNILTVCKRYDKAIEVLELTLSKYPLMAEILNGLGNLYCKKENSTKARDCYVKALHLKPDYAEAHFNLGLIMREWNRLDEAAGCFKNAILWDRLMFGAYLNLGETYQVLGEIAASEEVFNEALAIDSQNDTAYDNLLLSINYNELYSAAHVFVKHKKWGNCKTYQTCQYNSIKEPEKILKVGYVSPDFCKHPASQFLEPVVKSHSKNFEVYAYAQVLHRDSRTDYFKQSVSHWNETQELSDDELSRQIRNDGIDILVDCAGHMSGNRLGVFAMRPAPVQVSAFGYPCTSGLMSIDYRLSDSITENSESKGLYTESIILLDSCFCSYAPSENTPEITQLPALNNGFLTFGSLHTTARLNQQVITLWAQILNEIPSSRLKLFRTTLCGQVVEKLSTWFKNCNVDLSRIDFLNEIPKDGYLSVYNGIDCQLDTFPWSGHTTACESLWMGVPVITLFGDRHAGRMVSSVLHHIGMTDWICYSKDEYLQKAAQISNNVDLLGSIRKDLRSVMKSSVLLDGKKYTENLETQYRRVWTQFCGCQV
jgi:protein O-GlcNAc transferase